MNNTKVMGSSRAEREAIGRHLVQLQRAVVGLPARLSPSTNGVTR